MQHPAADRRDVTVVHVTHTNQLFWDCGTARSVVIEHGIIDPGHLFTGDIPRAAVVVNEPVRRDRVVGTDLLQRLAGALPLDLFGMETAPLACATIAVHDVPTQHDLHLAMARRCVYLHPVRWTSLGLSLIEAMHLGLPIVALATTEVPDAVPGDAGVVSNRVDVLEAALRCYANDREAAVTAGKAARAAALDRFGLERFLSEWNDLIDEVTA
jgi:glycosyltransferase involved in cell wall biosynthesis